jgi:repressor LexA
VTIGERIKKRRIESGLTVDELAEKLGKNRATVYRYESNEIEKLPTTVLEPLAKALGVSPGYLMGWEDENPSESNYESLYEKYDNIHPIHLKKFPMLGKIACGEPIYADEDRESFVMADMDIKADFCLTAKGDSMINARIYDGDVVFIKEMPMVDNGEIAAVIIEDEATLKRVYYYPEDSTLQLIAENPRYKPLIYQNEELNRIRVLGKAVYFMSAVE